MPPRTLHTGRNDLGDLRHDSVAERVEPLRGVGRPHVDGPRRFPKSGSVSGSSGPSVHPAGNPMSASTHAGFSECQRPASV